MKQMTKAEIRAYVASQRPDFQCLETDCVGAQRFASQGKRTFQTLEEKSAAIVGKLQGLEKKQGGGSASFQTLELFKQAKTIGAYMPLPDEVDVTPLFGFGSPLRSPSFGGQAAGGVAPPVGSESRGRANSPSEPQLQREKVFYIPAFDEALGSYRMAKYTPELKKGKFGIPEPENPIWAEADELDLILVPGVAFDRAGGRIGRGGGFYDRLLPQYNAIRAGICFDFQCLEKIPSEPHDGLMDVLITESKILKFAMNR